MAKNDEKAARPTKFEMVVVPVMAKILAWARAGVTKKDICEKIQLPTRTFDHYLTQGKNGREPYIDFYCQFMTASQAANEGVENALYRRCCGMTVTEIKVEEKLTKDGQRVKLSTETTKEIPPDPTSCIFWLINRKPKDWQNRKAAVEVEQAEGGVVLMPPVEVSSDGK